MSGQSPHDEYLLYPNAKQVMSLPQEDVWPFVMARLEEQAASKSPDYERCVGLGQLARRRELSGVEAGLIAWLTSPPSPTRLDAAALFLMGYWTGQETVSRDLVDALALGLAAHSEHVGMRDTAIAALHIAYRIARRDAAVVATIQEALRPFWPRRTELQAAVQRALSDVLEPLLRAPRTDWESYIEPLIYTRGNSTRVPRFQTTSSDA